jgi:hypothetical protein
VLPASFSLPHEVVPTLGNAADADIVIPLAMSPPPRRRGTARTTTLVGS